MFFTRKLTVDYSSADPKPPMLPGLLVFLSAGAVLTYNIEVCGIATLGTPAGVYPAGEPWLPPDNTTSGLSVSSTYTFQGGAMACRINITSYTSGSITASLVQP